MERNGIERVLQAIGRLGIQRGLLLLVLILSIAAFIYKADYTGTSYDEAMTFRDYCSSVQEARHNFKSTNNHVLNSIFSCIAHRWFGDYEQFIRIFPMLSGVAFMLACGYVVSRLVSSLWLRISGVISIFTVQMVFDYLVMARGYTYGLSAMMIYLAVVLFFMNKPLAFKFCWIPIVLLSVLNFLALGAMLSAVFVMLTLNAIFVLFYSPLLYRDAKSKIKIIAVHVISMMIVSGGLLVWLYYPILDDVLHAGQNPYVADIAKSWKGWSSYVQYIHDLLFGQMFTADASGRWTAGVFFTVLAVATAGQCAAIIRVVKRHQWSDYVTQQKSGLLVSLLFVTYFVLIFFHSVVLKHSPGLLRNQVFMIPPLLLSFLWLSDRLAARLSSLAARRIAVVCFCVLLGVISYRTRPHLRSIANDGMCMSRPTLKRLRALDPDIVWNLAFSQEMRYHYMGFMYYKQFDYKFNVNTGQQSNVLICRPDENRVVAPILDYEYFLKSCDCYVLLMGKQDTDKIIFEAKPKIAK